MKQPLLIILLANSIASAQIDSAEFHKDILAFQEELNAEYRDVSQSPLEPEALSTFKKHNYYEPDISYRVVAKLVRKKDSRFFKMKTSTPQFQTYRVYGMLVFELNGKSFELPVYQSKDLMKNPSYEKYLFFPFTDLTNGTETYGGGRYISLWIPQGNEIELDFNKAYNPYCAYSNRFSCPVVPSQNHMDVEVKAGVKFEAKPY